MKSLSNRSNQMAARQWNSIFFKEKEKEVAMWKISIVGLRC